MSNYSEEIERQFLIHHLPPDLDSHPKYGIDQGYLSIEKNREVRLRRSNDSYMLTVKSGRHMIRREEEIILTAEQFYTLWPLTEDFRIRKTRYRIPHNRFIIELDIYYEELQGFAAAEVEFANRADAQAFIPPPWFGREVTCDERYKNKNIVRGVFPGDIDCIKPG
ncbi:MAG: CYTH domain-containing protein [Fibrobacterota bacterium]